MNLLRPTVRLKLTLTYGGLFLVAGALLLALNYALVRRSVTSVGTGASVAFFAPKGSTGLAITQTPTRVIISSEGGPAGVGPLPGTIAVPEPTTPDGRKVSDVLRDLNAEYRNKTLHELVVKSLQALGLMAVLSVGFGWAVSGRVLGPLHQMTATAKKLSEENLHERIALDGPTTN